MTNFTQDDYQPNPATLLFIKQFARMCNNNKTKDNGYAGIPLIACC